MHFSGRIWKLGFQVPQFWRSVEVHPWLIIMKQWKSNRTVIDMHNRMIEDNIQHSGQATLNKSYLCLSNLDHLACLQQAEYQSDPQVSAPALHNLPVWACASRLLRRQSEIWQHHDGCQLEGLWHHLHLRRLHWLHQLYHLQLLKGEGTHPVRFCFGCSILSMPLMPVID